MYVCLESATINFTCSDKIELKEMTQDNPELNNQLKNVEFAQLDEDEELLELLVESDGHHLLDGMDNWLAGHVSSRHYIFVV